MDDKELIVDLRNQVDSNLNMSDEIIRYLNSVNSALQADVNRLSAENKRLKDKLLVIHERKVTIHESAFCYRSL